MSQYFRIHPENPQGRLIKHAADIIREGGVVVYPTDTAYAIGCMIGNKQALERIITIRRLDEKHQFSIMCRDLSEIATYARVSNSMFRLLKHHTPGTYTFILPGTGEVPKRLLHAKRKTIGLRVPNHPIVLALLEELNAPLLTSTMQLSGDEFPLTDPEEIRDRIAKQVDLIIDGGWGTTELTTVIDMVEEYPVVIREGKGDPAPFQ